MCPNADEFQILPAEEARKAELLLAAAKSQLAMNSVLGMPGRFLTLHPFRSPHAILA